MGVVTTGDTKINILYYFEIDNARLLQCYEKQTSTLDHLTKTCPRKLGSIRFSTLTWTERWEWYRRKTSKKEKEKEKNIQKEYIKHDAFSTMKKDFDIFQEKLFLHILKSCKNQVISSNRVHAIILVRKLLSQVTKFIPCHMMITY